MSRSGELTLLIVDLNTTMRFIFNIAKKNHSFLEVFSTIIFNTRFLVLTNGKSSDGVGRREELFVVFLFLFAPGPQSVVSACRLYIRVPNIKDGTWHIIT